MGVRFVDGTWASVVKNGGRVMKNVTGYDLVKLMAGSRGVLGVLTEVSFKVQAVPEAEATLVIEGLGRCGGACGAAGRRWARPSMFRVRRGIRGARLVRVEGMAGSVAYRVGRLKALVGGDVTVAEGARRVPPFGARSGM